MLRRTRIVCVSDTHNQAVKLPPGDVLIHAGDLTNQGSYSELSKAVKWLENADFEAKIVIAGNHDITLDEQFYSKHGHEFHNQNPQSPSVCLELFKSSPSITYLRHQSATIHLRSPHGPHTKFTVFGSPYSPRYGTWAFYYDAPDGPHDNIANIWDAIPRNTDIVVTHTPPAGYCDQTDEQRAGGCEALQRALWRVQPRLAVCGHIHDGRGSQLVHWDMDLECRDATHGAKSVVSWQDPGAGNNKLSLVDLTGRKALPLRETETCVVNASIMKSRYPHAHGKTFYKPIVVDINLPVWEEG